MAAMFKFRCDIFALRVFGTHDATAPDYLSAFRAHDGRLQRRRHLHAIHEVEGNSAGPPQNLGQPVTSLLPERTDTDGIALSRRNLSSGKSLIDAGYRPERASKWFSVHHTITPRRHRSREMKTPGMCHAKVWIEN
jgi:hypothetical protein